jgi:hypothetical protein
MQHNGRVGYVTIRDYKYRLKMWKLRKWHLKPTFYLPEFSEWIK